MVATGIRASVVIWLIGTSTVWGQFSPPRTPARQPSLVVPLAEGETPPSLLIEIPDEPRTIDPTQFVSPALAERVTAEFPETTLLNLTEWLQTERKLVVRLNRFELNKDNVPLDEPFYERLDDEPLYLLLDRLRSQGVGWYQQGEVLHLTNVTHAEEFLTTAPYVVSDLLDGGYDQFALIRVIQNSTGANSWEEDGGPGTLNLLGDVLFIRQTQAVHREVQGLQAALRKHGRMTYIDSPPHHAELRTALQKRITVSLDKMPLVQACREIGRIADVPVRIDTEKLREETVRERTPVSLDLTDQPLSVALEIVGADFGLTWELRDGHLWVTTITATEETMKTAVFDVRDLCRDSTESLALIGAVQMQSCNDTWEEDGGPGLIDAPKPGVLVVNQTERGLQEVLSLLENYRTALRASKPRERVVVDPNEILTHFYKLPTNIAEPLSKALPQLVEATSWLTAEQPDAAGTVLLLPSRATFVDPQGLEVVLSPVKAGERPKSAMIVENSVLRIRQSRRVHEEIVRLLHQISQGDQAEGMIGYGGVGGGLGGAMGGGQGGAMGGFGGGGQQGGFGGGYFGK